MSPAAELAHTTAVAQGLRFYTDPDTGLMVMTEIYHKERGSCCDSKCRHCPYKETTN